MLFLLLLLLYILLFFFLSSGLAYVFDYSGLNGESWVLEATLSAPNTVTADNFGESVSVDITNPSEPLVMVGIPGGNF